MNLTPIASLLRSPDAANDTSTSLLGTTFTRLTSQGGIEVDPSLAPDGEFLVYAGDTLGNLDVYLQGVGGEKAMNLTEACTADDRTPAFSPDGERIAFRSEREGGGIFLMGYFELGESRDLLF